MERFIIKDAKYDYRPIRLYYSNIEEARQKYPDAEITIDADKNFLESVEKIKAMSEHTLYDYRQREIWKIPYNNKYILYRQYIDEDGHYIDGCDYQRWDNITSTYPFAWTSSTPEEFAELFVIEKPFYDRENPCISQKELKKKKAKKFYNKNNKSYWRDANGLFYKADKCDLPNTVDKEEYKRFKGNTEAVYVRYGTEIAFSERDWFDNIDSFIEFFNDKKKSHPPYLGDLEYEVLKRGYKYAAPNERKVIIALPYIDVDKEIKLARKDTANENSIVRTVANIWCNQMDGIKFFGNSHGNIEWVEDIVKKYMELTQ